MHILTDHRQKQIEIIDKIEELSKKNSLSSSVVDPTDDYINDARICLTGVHFPSKLLTQQVVNKIISPLQSISTQHFFYPETSLHMTIKNVRIIHSPPNFNTKDIEKAKKAFSEIIPNHKKFYVYFYRLLLFPNNLALMGTTDPELDSIILDLDQKLKDHKIPDDKKYINTKYFFSNMTLARFTKKPSQKLIEKILEISSKLSLDPCQVDSVSLVSTNAAFTDKKILANWNLK